MLTLRGSVIRSLIKLYWQIEKESKFNYAATAVPSGVYIPSDTHVFCEYRAVEKWREAESVWAVEKWREAKPARA